MRRWYRRQNSVAVTVLALVTLPLKPVLHFSILC